MRVETDGLGAIGIEDGRYWGPQTERARLLCQIGTERFPPGLICAVSRQKWATAGANAALAEGVTLRKAAIAIGFVTAAEFDRWVRPEERLGPRAREA